MKLISKNKITEKFYNNELQNKIFKVHKNTYTYNNFEFKNMNTKSAITCSIHGDFEQSMNQHIFQKQGCPKCGIIKNSQNKIKKASNNFKEKASKIHNNTYIYNNVKYMGTHKKIEIICKEHGIFSQTPASHLSGKGCPKCAEIKKQEASFKAYYNKPTTLYYIEIIKDFKKFWKIGITTKSIKERYNRDKNLNYKILYEEKFENGKDAFLKEQMILRTFNSFKYKGSKILAGGNSEIFIKNVFLFS